MRIHYFGDPSSDLLLVQAADAGELKEMDEEIRLIKELSGESFLLAAAETDDWNAELSPWEAPAAFGKQGFSGGAADTLDFIDKNLLRDPELSKKRKIIGGYSLSALFALWSACKTDWFCGVAAASPSVWFNGFADFIRDNPPNAKCVYLSLGDREENTKNPTMRNVGEAIRRIDEELFVPHILKWNKGNHFADAPLRTAKGFAWVINELGKR